VTSALAATAVLLFAQSADLREKSERAQLWMAQQRFADAAELYQELTRALPGNAGLLVNLGMARHMAGQDAAAVAPLEAALRIQPAPPAFLFLGASYLRLGQPAKAIGPLRRFVAIEPKHAPARQMLADAAMTVENYAEAIPQLQRLSELEPASAAVWANLGRAYAGAARQTFDKMPPASGYFFALAAESRSKQNQNRAAFLFYRKALEKLPRHRGLHQGLAGVYRRTGHEDWAKQEEAAEAVLGQLDCRVRPGAAECAFAAGRYQQLAAAPSPPTPEALYWRVRAYDALSRAALAKLGELPASAESWRLQAELARDQGRPVEAVKAWHAAHALSPADVSIELELASALIAVKDYEEARLIADRLIASDPEAVEFNFLMGNLWASQQQPLKALPYLEKAAAKAPGLLPGRGVLGRVLLEAGRPGEAVAHLEAALPLDTDASLHFQLARALQSAGRGEEAKVAMAKYQAFRAKLGAAAEEVEAQTEITGPRR
jgi:predicted Zn-dependent protease